MSKISTIYDALITGIEARLTGHYRLPYPYEIEKNNEELLDIGYALRIGSVENTRRELCDRVYLRRTFEIVVTRRYWATSQNADNKASTEKDILEDAQKLYAWLEKAGSVSSDAKITQVALDNGIQQVAVGTDNAFYQLSCQLTIEYFESLEA